MANGRIVFPLPYAIPNPDYRSTDTDRVSRENLSNIPEPKGYKDWSKYLGKLKSEPKFQSRSKAKGKQNYAPSSPFNTPLGKQIEAMQAKQAQLLQEARRSNSTRKRNKKVNLALNLQAKIEILQSRLNLT